MWFDFLPVAAAFIFVTYSPHILLPYWEEFVHGNKYYKNTDLFEVRREWFRNMYLTGNGNLPTGMDAIPDLPESNETSKTQ